MAKVLTIAGCGVASVALILAIVAVAVNSWVSASKGIITSSSGLWKSCLNDVCVKLTETEINDDLKAVRAMMILGILLLPAAIICLVMKMLVMKDNDVLPLIGGVIAGVAGLFLMVAMALFHNKIYKKIPVSGFDLSTGFALDVTGWILAWVAAALMIASKFVVK